MIASPATATLVSMTLPLRRRALFSLLVPLPGLAIPGFGHATAGGGGGGHSPIGPGISVSTLYQAAPLPNTTVDRFGSAVYERLVSSERAKR